MSDLAFPGGKLIVVLDDLPPGAGLVEIENINGVGHRVGEYKRRPDGLWALEIDLAEELSRQAPLTR